MKVAVTAAILSLAFATAVAGQNLETGTWNGTVSPPGGSTVDVQYEVGYEGETLVITMTSPMGTFPFGDLSYENGVLGFNWNPGLLLTCELIRDDAGSFEGECLDGGGTPGVLTMTPPAG